jgi:Acyl-coenzyme A synthetases/AMP-(fatty) acid ligases
VDRAAARLANALEAGGFAPADRLAIVLPQSPEALIAHCAAYRFGGIAVPLFTLFGKDGLA